MGAPEFALPSLERLLGDGHEIVLVVTQPDRPAGRGQRLRPTPVAQAAHTRGLAVYKTDSLRTPEARGPLGATSVDAIVVAAFGLYLPSTVLAVPQRGSLNVHPSLLPRHRGPSPIQAAILAGDETTGVTVIEVAARMDAGAIVGQRSTQLRPTDDAPALEQRLAEMGADLLAEVLEPWHTSALAPREQDETLATYSSRISHADGELQWREPADALWRRVRAYHGWPDAYTRWEGRMLKVLRADPVAGNQGSEAGDQDPGAAGQPVPGQVYAWRPESGGAPWPAVACGEGALILRSVVLAGKRPSSGEAFLRGYPGFDGAILG